MPPVQFIIYHDTKILLMDFTGAKTTTEITQTAEEIKKICRDTTPAILGGIA